MAVIYLKHPQHGAKVASSKEEAQADKARGWFEFDPSAPKVEPVVAQSASQKDPETPILNELPARRGRARKQ